MQEIKMDNRRFDVVQNMYKVATVKWTPSESFLTVSRRGNRSYYEKGLYYYGVPYNMDNKVSFVDFCNKLDNFVIDTKVPCGMDCIFSIIDVFSFVFKIPSQYLTFDFMFDRNFSDLLCDFSFNSDDIDNFKVNYNEVFEGYAKLKIADVLCTYIKKSLVGWLGHTRLVSGMPHVERYSDGIINPDKSYVIVIDSKAYLEDTKDVNNFGGKINNSDVVVPFQVDEKFTDIKDLSDMYLKNTNFSINKKMSFSMLYNVFFLNGCCLPYRLKCFND